MVVSFTKLFKAIYHALYYTKETLFISQSGAQGEGILDLCVSVCLSLFLSVEGSKEFYRVQEDPK